MCKLGTNMVSQAKACLVWLIFGRRQRKSVPAEAAKAPPIALGQGASIEYIISSVTVKVQCGTFNPEQLEIMLT